MHEWLRCTSGVGVTALNCCGLLQHFITIVIACHGGIRPAYKRYATLIVITLFLLTTVTHAH